MPGRSPAVPGMLPCFALLSSLPPALVCASFVFVMIETLKKTLLAGVGATVVTAEKIEAALNEYVAKGKVSAEEARATAQRIAEEGRKEWETTSADLSKKIEALIARANFAPRSELEALAARVKALEEKLPASAATPEATPAAPPPAAG